MVVGVVEPVAVPPVGSTGAGADHEIGVALGDWVPGDELWVPDDGPDVDDPAVVGVDEPVGEAFGDGADPVAPVVDGAPVVGDDPELPEPADPT